MTTKITVETLVSVSPGEAWRVYTSPDAITQWNFASPEWHCPRAVVDLRVGGRHCARMEAKDGSMGFDYEGAYEAVDAERSLILRLDDGRLVHTTFDPEADSTRVRTVFDADPGAPTDMQRDGWQAILDNYADFVRQQS